MEAIGRELLRVDIVPEITGLGALGHQIPHQMLELLVCVGEMFASMHQRCELVAMPFMGDESVSLQDRFQLPVRTVDFVTDRGQLLEVPGDLAFVPRRQDRIDVWKVPLSLASLLTGLVQSLGTTWGLLRHYWVLVKLVMTVLATALLLVHMQVADRVAGAAAQSALAGADLVGMRVQLVADAGAALVVLLVAVTLSVYKPRGRVSEIVSS